MKKFLLKYYVIYIYCLVGIPIFTITYFSIKDEFIDIFWFLMVVGIISVTILQLKWMQIPKKCDHSKNVRIFKYFLDDMTPMIEYDCYDCGYNDHGHVHAENWFGSLTIIKNGKVEIYQTFNK